MGHSKHSKSCSCDNHEKKEGGNREGKEERNGRMTRREGEEKGAKAEVVRPEWVEGILVVGGGGAGAGREAAEEGEGTPEGGGAVGAFTVLTMSCVSRDRRVME